MKVILILLTLLLAVGAAWVGITKLSKNKLFEDKDNDNIPDIVEEKAEEIKAKVKKVKTKAKEVKEVINKK